MAVKDLISQSLQVLDDKDTGLNQDLVILKTLWTEQRKEILETKSKLLTLINSVTSSFLSSMVTQLYDEEENVHLMKETNKEEREQAMESYTMVSGYKRKRVVKVQEEEEIRIKRIKGDEQKVNMEISEKWDVQRYFDQIHEKIEDMNSE